MPAARPRGHPAASRDVVLCVTNLSRFAQPAQLPLQRWQGMTPVELLGRVPFPPITELPYFVTLPPYGFYWFGLADRPSARLEVDHGARNRLCQKSFLRLLVDLLGPYLARQRWYAVGTARPGRPHDRVRLSGGARRPSRRLLWAIVEAQGADYQVVIAERPVGEVAEHLKGHEDALIGSVGDSVYYDATIDTEMALALLRAASGGLQTAERSRPLSAEQSNTSLVYDDRLILKFFRRLTVGPNPDVEVTSALASTGFSHIALPLVRWQRNGRDLAFGQQYLAGGSDGWALALTSLRDFYGSASPGTDPTRRCRGAISLRKRTALAR